jgi:hypothetical protein
VVELVMASEEDDNDAKKLTTVDELTKYVSARVK